MRTIRYIHAADLHLDTPFTGIARSGNEELAHRMKDATFVALENLALLCETEKPDFLLLAGDIYNQEERSVRAQLRLREVCARLERIGIPVFICHGNHDPLTSRLASISWPGNVTIFGPDPTYASVVKDGDTIALVHGASHANGRESRNLAQLFHRDPGQSCFQAGLLHCNVDGAVASDRYASCSLEDLRSSGLDAWALGHSHESRILSWRPFIAYSGDTQGVKASETGPKGCFLITAQNDQEQWTCEAQFMELAPVQWLDINIDLENVKALNEVLGKIEAAMLADTDTSEHCEGIIFTVTLTGRTPLAAELARPATIEDLCSQLAPLANEKPALWLRKIIVKTAPLLDQAEIIDRDDLLGEIARLAASLGHDEEALKKLADRALAPLYGNRRYGALLEKPDRTALEDLLRSAQRACLDLLEGR